MTNDCYLILAKGRGYRNFRIVGTRRKLREAFKGEAIIKLTIKIPDNLFDEPMLLATTTIDESHVQPPRVVVKPVTA